jgi:hypothetical protein
MAGPSLAKGVVNQARSLTKLPNYCPHDLEQLSTGFVPYSPVGTGLLTDKIDENTRLDSTDFRKTVPRFTS